MTPCMWILLAYLKDHRGAMRHYLVSFTGWKPEHVSKTLQQLKQLGLIAHNPSGLCTGYWVIMPSGTAMIVEARQ
jgi:hypothetical protein